MVFLSLLNFTDGTVLEICTSLREALKTVFHDIFLKGRKGVAEFKFPYHPNPNPKEVYPKKFPFRPKLFPSSMPITRPTPVHLPSLLFCDRAILP